MKHMMTNIFIPSYHRPTNLISVKYLNNIGYDMKCVYIFIDSATDDKDEYEKTAKKYGFNLVVFDMAEARRRYDYVHRPTPALRSVGQARNMFFDYAAEHNIDFYVVMDDDTSHYTIRWGKPYISGTLKDGKILANIYASVESMMKRRHIGLFGLSQCGDLIGGCDDNKLFRAKVMNTTFYLTKYIYRGERGVQDEDTSQFVGVYNEGLFTGSFRYGLCLQQVQSATSKGGLTDLYHEAKLLNKALVCPIQFPSCIRGEKQEQNGGRLHHRINNKYLMPKILKIPNGRDNIAWDTFPEDYPFTNEPKRSYDLNRE